jgi:hypothetical protein
MELATAKRMVGTAPNRKGKKLMPLATRKVITSGKREEIWTT